VCSSDLFNQPARDYERDQTVTQVFEARVSEGPTAIALVCGKEQLTYAELDNRADRLSAQLRSLGVRPGAMVGICLERSPELVISLLAILKTGGTYVPL